MIIKCYNLLVQTLVVLLFDKKYLYIEKNSTHSLFSSLARNLNKATNRVEVCMKEQLWGCSFFMYFIIFNYFQLNKVLILVNIYG